jgi:predicted ATPase
LVVLIFRPDFTPPWARRSHMTPLALNRLGRRQVEAMVENLTGGKALPAEVVQQVVSKTDGVPLFVEELTKMVLESGLLREAEGRYDLTGPLRPLAIPATLQDSLMARLDRLSPVKEVAQLGATLGREFAYELLQAVWPGDELNLRQAVSKLLDAEVLHQRGLPPQARYVFKHALIQDAAYQSLLKSKRQQYHQQIARVLEEQFPETKEVQPELLAHHYTEAGLSAQAIPYWQRAGQRASQRSAHVEAISHCTKGLQLLQPLPDTPARAQQELTLQIALGPALMASKGYAAPEVEEAFARARELCQRIGETPQLFPVLLGLRSFYTVRGEYHIARELGEQLLRLAQRVQDAALLLEAHHALGGSLFWLGEHDLAQTHIEQVLTLYDPQQHRAHAFRYGQDPGVVCLSYMSLILWLRGYPDQALQRSGEALTLAKEVAHPFSLALALSFAAGLHQCRGEGQRTREGAEALIALSREQGFPFYVAVGTVSRGWAVAERGQGEKAIPQMHQALAALQAMGVKLSQPYYLSLLAEIYGKGGRAEEGLGMLAAALATVKQTGERYYEADLYRLKGELTRQKEAGGGRREASPPSPQASSLPPQVSPEVALEVEGCFQKAIEIARGQSARSLELRAVMSLSRLWQHQGKQEEARQLLAEIYGWFTEGFDTKDLQEAKALLEELNH